MGRSIGNRKGNLERDILKDRVIRKPERQSGERESISRAIPKLRFPHGWPEPEAKRPLDRE